MEARVCKCITREVKGGGKWNQNVFDNLFGNTINNYFEPVRKHLKFEYCNNLKHFLLSEVVFFKIGLM